MDNIQELYQEMILEHNRNPRNFKVVEAPTHTAHGINPLCGDDYHVHLKISDKNILEDISFHGDGCAISKSSGSMMTRFLKGISIDELILIKDAFLSLLTEENPNHQDNILENLVIFKGVKEFPVRVKCATLVWRALEAALSQKNGGEVTTE